MVATVLALLALFLGAALVGTLVTGLFWLTLVALAGILGTGAVGVSRLGVPDDDAPANARRSHLRLVRTGSGAARGDRTGHGGVDWAA